MNKLGSKDVENLRIYYQHASSELRFYKKQIMSLTNYTVLLNDAFIYFHDNYNINKCIFIASSIILCVVVIFFICRINNTIEYMRAALDKIAELFGGHFESIAGKHGNIDHDGERHYARSSFLFKDIFHWLYIIFHIILIISVCCIICCAEKNILML